MLIFAPVFIPVTYKVTGMLLLKLSV